MVDYTEQNEALKAALAAGEMYEREAAKLTDLGALDRALEAISRAREADAQAARLLVEMVKAPGQPASHRSHVPTRPDR